MTATKRARQTHRAQSDTARNDAHPTIGGDLVWGAPGIAAEIGVSVRRAYYLLDRRLIPARQIGAIWCASRRQLRARLLGDADDAA
jgi:hypothetical protein